jgi:hypothetical protein
VLTQLTDRLPRVADDWAGNSEAGLWATGGDLTEISYLEALGC